MTAGQMLCPKRSHPRGGSLLDLLPFARRVAGSNPALAAMYGPWA